MADATKVTPKKRAQALALRRRGYNMDEAAKQTGISRVQWWRIRKDDPEFAEAWDDAHEESIDKLENCMMERAINGTVKVTRKYDPTTGNVIREDETIEYDTTLQIFMLKHQRPETYNPSVKIESTQKTEINAHVTHELSTPEHVLATWAITLQHNPAYKHLAPTLLPGVQEALAALPEAEAREITHE